jgi:hypothetical protein
MIPQAVAGKTSMCTELSRSSCDVEWGCIPVEVYVHCEGAASAGGMLP